VYLWQRLDLSEGSIKVSEYTKEPYGAEYAATATPLHVLHEENHWSLLLPLEPGKHCFDQHLRSYIKILLFVLSCLPLGC
jgi:hypothetical protein